MGETPKDVITVSIRPIIVNDRIISKVIIDMRHINYGKNGLFPRSSHDLDSIVKLIFELHEESFEPNNSKDGFTYFSEVINYLGKTYKIVFCIPDQQNWLGIITLFRIT